MNQILLNTDEAPGLKDRKLVMSMLVMSTSLANDVIEEYEDQSNSECGGGGGGEEKSLYYAPTCKLQSKRRKGAYTFTFHKPFGQDCSKTQFLSTL